MLRSLPTGGSPWPHKLKTLSARAAGGDAKVLVTGESGVGKDVVARFIHARSNRSPRPFVAVNCAAFSETLLESELFGHVRGSFTGAHRDKIGKLQQAHKGTVFLDEVGEMSLRMQALLLRFLESGEIQPVGADGGGTTVDVRVISATNRDLPALIASGQFREDLMYRIRVIHLLVPPLRARREDIKPLIEHTIQRSGRPLKLSDEAMQALEQYRWPGNVRQLQNMIEQLSWMSSKDTVSLDDLPGALRIKRPRFSWTRIKGESNVHREVGKMVRSRDVVQAEGSARTEGARRATGVRADGAAAGAGSLAPGQRWSASRKRDVVLRLLRGESLEALSREAGVEIYRLDAWRERAMAGLELGLKARHGEPVAEMLDAAKRHIGELSMEIELLRERARAAEQRLPLAMRRSRR